MDVEGRGLEGVNDVVGIVLQFSELNDTNVEQFSWDGTPPW
jgi:hypothetical protein